MPLTFHVRSLTPGTVGADVPTTQAPTGWGALLIPPRPTPHPAHAPSPCISYLHDRTMVLPGRRQRWAAEVLLLPLHLMQLQLELLLLLLLLLLHLLNVL